MLSASTRDSRGSRPLAAKPGDHSGSRTLLPETFPMASRESGPKPARSSGNSRTRSSKSKLETLHLLDLQRSSVPALVKLLEDLGGDPPPQPNHHDLVIRILLKHTEQGGQVIGHGFLEVLPDGFGFLRSPHYNYQPGPDDIYVSPSQIVRFGLRDGSEIEGPLRPPKNNEKYFALFQVGSIEGMDPEARRRMTPFEELTPRYPTGRLQLETSGGTLANRVIDLLAPMGKGQRALVVAPPKAGKTMLLQGIANGILANHEDVHLIVLLVDERPEEVTDMREAVRSERAEVVASTFDEAPIRHMHAMKMVLGKAKRLVERGKDVVILLDSITRLARASNVDSPSSGKLLSGGLDPTAMQRPKAFFGAARDLDGAGSLTIVATALIDTGSRMDEVIFEEFKGTGNCEIVLDRGLADRRIFPAIDVLKTGTRREELLLTEEDLHRVHVLRKVLAGMPPHEATELLLDKLKRSTSNREFLSSLRAD